MAEKILIVDDDLDTLRLVRIMLEKQGYEVTAATSGEQALTTVNTFAPNLILLDIMMPVMDGYEVARRIRRDESNTHVPILMFTAKSQVEDKVTGYEAGGDSYLTKPTHPDELIARVKTLLATKSTPITSVVPSKHWVIGVLSAVGGIGTTTLALNTSIALKKTTHANVLLAELRPSHGTLAEELGLSEDHVIENLLRPYSSDLSDTVIQKEIIPHASGIKLLLASSNPESIVYQKEGARIRDLVNLLKQNNDYVLLDIGLNILPDLDSLIGLCDQIILTIEPAPNSIIRARKLLDYLEARGYPRSRPLTIVLVNRIRSEMQLTLTKIQEILKYDVNLAVSPVPELAYQAGVKKQPMIELDVNSLTAQQFNQIAQAIIRE